MIRTSPSSTYFSSRLTSIFAPFFHSVNYPTKVNGPTHKFISVMHSQNQSHWQTQDTHIHTEHQANPVHDLLLTKTTLCSCKLWPSPWIYAIVCFPVDSLTRATFRFAELGFFGFITKIWEQLLLSAEAHSPVAAR